MKIFIIFLFFIFPNLSFAYIPADFPNYFYENASLSIEQITISNNCYSIPSTEIGINCNPAFITKNKRRNLQFNFISSDTISRVEGYAKNVNHESSFDLINRTLKQDQPYLGQAQASFWYAYDNFEISLTPARIGVASDIRNPSLQEVSLHSSVQSELALRFGYFIDPHDKFSFGSNLKYNHTKFIRERFEVLSASVDPTFLKVRESDTVYIDQGISYKFENFYNSIFSVTFTNIKLYESGGNLPIKGSIEIGYYISPKLFKRHFKSSIHFTARKDYPNLEDRIGWGGIIIFNPKLNLNFSLSKPKQAISLIKTFSFLSLGFGYINERRNFNGYRKENFNYLLFQIGLISNNNYHHAHE